MFAGTEWPVTVAGALTACLEPKARQGSAGDAMVVTIAEHGGTVLTGDEADLNALAADAGDVHVELV